MSQVLGSIRVPPLYGQVVVEAEGASDLPVPETGEEKVVSTTESILVATRGDKDGDVSIEVRRGNTENLGHVIFDGELSFSTPRLVFGSSLANQLGSIDVGRTGWIPIKIYVDSVDGPSRVVVVVT